MNGRPHPILRRYSFQHTGSTPTTYRRTSGPFVVRVSVMDDGAAHLHLGLLSHTPGVAEVTHRWSVEVGPDLDAVALEAAWFVAVVEGLTPPVVGGKVLDVGTTNQEGPQ